MKSLARDSVALFLLLFSLVIASTLAPAASAAPAAPAAPAASDELCGTCKTTGKVPVETAMKSELEATCQFCSVVMDREPESLGLDWKPCPNCKAPNALARAKKEFEQNLSVRRAWLEKRREADKLVRTKLVHAQSPHFVLTFGIPQIKVGEAALDSHRAMHLYLQRAEDLRKKILDFHGWTEADQSPLMHELLMFERLKEAQVAAVPYTGLALPAGVKVFKVGLERSSIVMWDDPESIRNDEDRHQCFTHTISHLIYHLPNCYKWWLFDKHGWLFEGEAYFWEFRLFGTPRTHCSQENVGGSKTTSNFEAAVKKAVGMGGGVSFANLIERNAATLSTADRQFSWAFVDFLNWRDPKAFARFHCALLVPEVATRDALRDAYGLSIGQLQEEFVDFVRTEYSTVPKKGPNPREPRKP